MGEPRVSVDGVWKRYRRRGTGLSGVLALLRGRESPDLRWALRDVSFSLAAGEALGVIGENGAGKTTLLRLVAGITPPSRGRIDARGRVASLISLGAGFHPELTGRENILLNGVILGLTRREVRERFDAIVDFAEVRDALDMPVKHYSSGMFARLGFSVAVHTGPQVLLVDEVLSVGDYAFQRKSFERMRAFRERGTAVVFVSHSLGGILELCDRVLWLDGGGMRRLGDAADTVTAYVEDQERRTLARMGEEARAAGKGPAPAPIRIERVVLHRGDGRPSEDFRYGEALFVRMEYAASAPVERPRFHVQVLGRGDEIFEASMVQDGMAPGLVPAGTGWVECRFASLPLLPGVYRVRCGIKEDVRASYEVLAPRAAFRVVTPAIRYGFAEPESAVLARNRSIVPYSWRWGGAGREELPLGRVEPRRDAGADQVG